MLKYGGAGGVEDAPRLKVLPQLRVLLSVTTTDSGDSVAEPQRRRTVQLHRGSCNKSQMGELEFVSKAQLAHGRKGSCAKRRSWSNSRESVHTGEACTGWSIDHRQHKRARNTTNIPERWIILFEWNWPEAGKQLLDFLAWCPRVVVEPLACLPTAFIGIQWWILAVWSSEPSRREISTASCWWCLSSLYQIVLPGSCLPCDLNPYTCTLVYKDIQALRFLCLRLMLRRHWIFINYLDLPLFNEELLSQEFVKCWHSDRHHLPWDHDYHGSIPISFLYYCPSS